MPWWRTALYTAGILAFALWVESGTVPSQPQFPQDGHAINSLDLALASTMCGAHANMSQEYEPAKFLSANQWATSTPLRAVAVRMAGSVERFCASANYPLLNEDT